MALFSDIDWIIIAAVGGFLLFGRGNTQALRTLGRWYGRATRLKQELMGEFARAADLPFPTGGSAGSIRSALLGLGSDAPPTRGVPIAVTTPPGPPAGPEPWNPSVPWAGGSVATSWSTSGESVRPNPEGWK
jgi:hypothetical protein